MLPSDVTVLLPAHNAEVTVEAAIQSVFDDAHGSALQVVVVDDASADSTRSRIEEMARGEPRLHVVSGPGLGLVAALECGRRQIETHLVARMDADDLWLQGRLRAQLRALDADPGLAGVGGEVEVFSDGPVGEGMRRYVEWINSNHAPDELHRERYVESPLVHPAVLLRRAVLEAVGGYREGPFPEDYELWLRLLASGARLANVAQPVLRWRDSASRLTRTHSHYRPEAHRLLKVRYLLQESFAAQPLWIAGAGSTGLPLARALREKGAQVERFVEVHPRKIGTCIEGVPVIGYEQLQGPEAAHLLVAVGVPSARKEVRAFLSQRGWVEGRDFTCVA